MSRTIRISEETANVINELGGAFDSPDDVIQQLIRDAGYSNKLNEHKSKTGPHQSSNSADGYTAIISLPNGEKEEIEIFDKQSEAMKSVVEVLVYKADLLEKVSIPYIPPRSRNQQNPQALISDVSRHPSGREMNGYKEIEGYYLHTGYDSAGKKERIKDLADECDVDVSFEGDW
jgi:hypothetical protein